MRKQNGIYPCFESRIKCVDTFKDFTHGNEYRIEGFGKDKRNNIKMDVWYIKNLNNEEPIFTVVKTTVNALIDSGTLKIYYKSDESISFNG